MCVECISQGEFLLEPIYENANSILHINALESRERRLIYEHEDSILEYTVERCGLHKANCLKLTRYVSWYTAVTQPEFIESLLEKPIAKKLANFLK